MEIIKFLQSFSNPLLDTLFEGITFLGEENFYILVVTLVFWCINKKFGYKLGFLFLSNMALNGSIKEVFNVSRPIGVEGIRSLRLETALGSSFPSGHTQGAAGFWLALMLKIKKRWFYVLGALLTLLIGISRLYLGVHWPRDVVFGILFGTAWVFITGYILNQSERRGNKLIALVLLAPYVALLLFFKSSDFIKTTATLTGFFAGYCAEDKYISFNEKADLGKQIFKYSAGIAGVFLLKSLLKAILPASLISDFFRYVIIGLWISAGAPYIFKNFICKQEHNSRRMVELSIQ